MRCAYFLCSSHTFYEVCIRFMQSAYFLCSLHTFYALCILFMQSAYFSSNLHTFCTFFHSALLFHFLTGKTLCCNSRQIHTFLIYELLLIVFICVHLNSWIHFQQISELLILRDLFHHKRTLDVMSVLLSPPANSIIAQKSPLYMLSFSNSLWRDFWPKEKGAESK